MGGAAGKPRFTCNHCRPEWHRECEADEIGACIVCDRYLYRWRAVADISYEKQARDGGVALMDGRERRALWERAYLQQGWRDDINEDPMNHYSVKGYTMIQYFCNECNGGTGGPIGYSTYKEDGYVLRSWK